MAVKEGAGAVGEGNVSREDLGERVVEGVTAPGTRTTIVLQTGTVGNEQPIAILSEQWFSPDLQVLVSIRHSDPRGGETTFRLTNIVRAEPDRSLFEVPADYTIKETGIRRRSFKQQFDKVPCIGRRQPQPQRHSSCRRDCSSCLCSSVFFSAV